VTWTAAGVEASMTGGDAVDDKLPRRLHDLHDSLLEAAKSPLPEAQPVQGAAPRGSNDLSPQVEAQRRELEYLRLELARTRGYIEALRAEVEVRSLEPADLREVALNLEQQLVERDEELDKLRKVVREGDAWRREMEAARRETEESLNRGIEALREELELIKSTRLWSAGQRYWTLKERLRQALRRGSP
jgi:chromosome segregation ATPase